MSNGGPPITDDAPKIRVVRIHLNDWVAATRGMSLDEEGFFWRLTVLLYDRMGTLADDDMANARAMSLDVRIYRKMKARMVALGKIAIDGERISNARVEREISMYVAECKRRSEAALEREQKKRGELQKELQAYTDRADFRRTSGKLTPTSSQEVLKKSERSIEDRNEHLSEKDNEIKGRTATTLAQDDHTLTRAHVPKPKPKPLSEVKKDPLTPPSGGPTPLDQAFEEFWRSFPDGRKQGKGDARDAFCKIVQGRHRKGLRAKAETLIAAAKGYAASKPDREFVPMPSTWLNGGRWEDADAATVAPSPGDPEPRDGKAWGWWRGREDKFRSLTEARWRKALAETPPNGTWPWWIFGAPPGHPECLLPSELVAEFGYLEIYQGNIKHV